MRCERCGIHINHDPDVNLCDDCAEEIDKANAAMADEDKEEE